MKYILTPDEKKELAEVYQVPEAFMRLMINYINSFEASYECSMMGEIDYLIENPHEIKGSLETKPNQPIP